MEKESGAKLALDTREFCILSLNAFLVKYRPTPVPYSLESGTTLSGSWVQDWKYQQSSLVSRSFHHRGKSIVLSKPLSSSFTSCLWHGLLVLECMSQEVVTCAFFGGGIFLLASPRFSPGAPQSCSHFVPKCVFLLPTSTIKLFLWLCQDSGAEKLCHSCSCRLDNAAQEQSYYLLFLP